MVQLYSRKGKGLGVLVVILYSQEGWGLCKYFTYKNSVVLNAGSLEHFATISPLNIFCICQETKFNITANNFIALKSIVRTCLIIQVMAMMSKKIILSFLVPLQWLMWYLNTIIPWNWKTCFKNTELNPKRLANSRGFQFQGIGKKSLGLNQFQRIEFHLLWIRAQEVDTLGHRKLIPQVFFFDLDLSNLT